MQNNKINDLINKNTIIKNLILLDKLIVNSL